LLDADANIHSEISSLIKNCWSEMADERPKIEEVREVLLKHSGGNNVISLMDHVR
jgi:hypothetical protein